MEARTAHYASCTPTSTAISSSSELTKGVGIGGNIPLMSKTPVAEVGLVENGCAFPIVLK